MIGRYRRGTSPHHQGWMDLVSSCPEMSGVYFVWAGDELLYVGSSIKMRERLVMHTYRDLFAEEGVSKVTWAEFWSGNMGEVEKWLIQEFRPRLNTVHVRPLCPEGHMICKCCHETKTLYCFGVNAKPERATCAKCCKEKASKYAIRPLNMPVVVRGSVHHAEIKVYRTDSCFVCQKPSHRKFGNVGACKEHFRELAALAHDGFSKRTALFEEKSASFQEDRRQADYRDLNRFRRPA